MTVPFARACAAAPPLQILSRLLRARPSGAEGKGPDAWMPKIDRGSAPLVRAPAPPPLTIQARGYTLLFHVASSHRWPSWAQRHYRGKAFQTARLLSSAGQEAQLLDLYMG